MIEPGLPTTPDETAPQTPPAELATVTVDAEIEAEDQRREAWRRTMNDMRASRTAQGNYFASFGGGARNSDALVLIAPPSTDHTDSRSTYDGYIAITQEGPVIIYPNKAHDRENLREILVSRANMRIQTAAEAEAGGYSLGARMLNLGDSGWDFPTRPITDLAIVQSAIEASISKARLARLNSTRASIDLATQLSTAIQAIPPRG